MLISSHKRGLSRGSRVAMRGELGVGMGLPGDFQVSRFFVRYGLIVAQCRVRKRKFGKIVTQCHYKKVRTYITDQNDYIKAT